MNDKTTPPADAPASPAGNDAGLANDLMRLEAGAASQPDVPPEVAALRAQEQQANVNAVAEWEALLVGISQPTFDVFAPNWQVTDNETKAWAKAVAPCAAKYFPDVNASVEVTALLATVMIFGPRLSVPRKLPEKPAEAAKA